MKTPSDNNNASDIERLSLKDYLIQRSIKEAGTPKPSLTVDDTETILRHSSPEITIKLAKDATQPTQ
jgi:hypothetical protein